jgi:hypothetical protein
LKALKALKALKGAEGGITRTPLAHSSRAFK